jgi:WD40 repeat protein
MNSFDNENILKLTFSNITLYSTKQLLKKLKNKKITNTLLKIITWENIFKSMGQATTILKGHTNQINSLTSCGDNNIISASWDKTLKIWNANSNICIQTLEGSKSIESVIILPNDKIASCSINEIMIWDIKANFKCIKILCCDNYRVFNNLLLLTNSTFAFSADYTVPCIIIVDCDNKYCISKELTQCASVYSLINIFDNRFASASLDMIINIWSNSDYKCVGKLVTGHLERITTLAYSIKDDVLLSGSKDKTIKVWDLSTFICVRIIENNNEVRSLLILPNGFFASGYYDGSIKIWRNYKCINSLKKHSDKVTKLLFLDDYRTVSSSFDKSIIIWHY